MTDSARYAELHVTSNFTFLHGASHAEELALTAAALGLGALAITDRNTLAGVVRAHLAARSAGIRLVVGCRLDLRDGPSLLAYPTDRAAYGRLSRLLTVGKRRAPKGACHLDVADVCDHARGLRLLALPPETPEAMDTGFATTLADYRARFGDGGLGLAVSHRYRGDDRRRLARLAELATAARLPLVATNDVLYHSPARRPLQDVLTCIRERCTIDEAGWRLAANAERHLKAPAEMARLFRHSPEALAGTLELVDACRFSLDDLRYEYPDEVAAPGETAQQGLARLTWQGAAGRYPDGIPERVQASLEHELALIDRLGYAAYFLTVQDIVAFARSRGILCQGRGSAANSAVCYCLGITAVDPARADLLFERFISAARNEPPDIDVDFEHERREEVIQYLYQKYGRDRAGLTAVVIRFRARAALRDVGKVMGLSADTVARLTGSGFTRSREVLDEQRIREHGLDPGEARLGRTLELARDLIGFPRHLSQHVGGFVITRGPLTELSPVLNAAMPGRTTIEWDKDDIDALGILKIDVLALGMLTCIRRAFDLIAAHHGRVLTLATLPPDDPAVYDMLCRADSLGVFQVESRAQMSMLPRLRPRTFYDLVIEVAIVRPGPIQGDMVHPYLRRRAGHEPVDYPSEALRRVLEKTLGIPLFQEQAMRIAIVGAGFTPAEADQLRRAMATFRHAGTIQMFERKLIDGMVARGYAPDFAERCFRQIEGFGTYGFPESHAASFALLVYVSAWLKCHYPAAFACALLNSQPMGFYAPAQIVRDAREHGVTVLEPDVNASDWECRLEEGGDPEAPAFRLGFRQIKGAREDDAGRLVAARGSGFRDAFDLWRKTGLSMTALETLARADAFRSLGLDRRAALWTLRGLGEAPLPLFAGLDRPAATEPEVVLPEMPLGEHVVEDYASLSLSLKCHPLALLRPALAARGLVPAARLALVRPGAPLRIAGLVVVRQRPGTAKGIIFITLEDETAIANLIVRPDVFERCRKALLAARLLAATGRVERHDHVTHLLVQHLADFSDLLASLAVDRPAAPTFPDGRNFR
jgi:error-prone DNA polymerase